MFSSIISVFLMFMFTTTILAIENNDNSRVIFGARCEARCFAKNQFSKVNGSMPCNGAWYQACNKPCIDTANFYKVKSCTKYCREFARDKYNKECKTSCKILMRLHNTGGDKSRQNMHKDKLPGRPADVNCTLQTKRKQTQMIITWSYSSSRPSTQVPIFLVETRYYKELPFYMSDWHYLYKTSAKTIQITPRPAAWSEYRVMAVNEYGTSDYSSPSTPVYVMPNRPSAPRDFRVDNMIIRKDKVSMKLAWSKPLNSEIPVHRYRLFWSPRLDIHTKKLHSLRVLHVKLKGDIHSHTIHGLLVNTTYVFELQANCHFKGQRLRSKRVILTRRTLDKEKLASPIKLFKKKKKTKVMKNCNNKPAKIEKLKTTEQSQPEKLASPIKLFKKKKKTKVMKNSNNKPAKIEKLKTTEQSRKMVTSVDDSFSTQGSVTVAGLRSTAHRTTIISWLWLVVMVTTTVLLQS